MNAARPIQDASRLRLPCRPVALYWSGSRVSPAEPWLWVRPELLMVVFCLAGFVFSAWGNETLKDEAPFRVGFSLTSFGDVNENDATAAVRVWARALATERGIPADPQPKVLRDIAEIEAALTNKTIDAINLSAEEFATLRERVPLQDCVVSVKGNSVTEEYVLLVHRSGRIAKLADLRDHKLGLLNGSRTALIPAWLETTLASEHLGRLNKFCSQIITAPKVSKLVLPVFFKQLDACVVTRNGYETMVELNPQVGQQLKVLASSPPLVPALFCFRADYTSTVRKQVLDEIALWHTSAAGRQILTIFQSDSLEERPLNCLDTALELIRQHQELCRESHSIGEDGSSLTSQDTNGGAK